MSLAGLFGLLVMLERQMVQEVGTQLNEAVIGAKSIDQALADAQAAADQITGR